MVNFESRTTSPASSVLTVHEIDPTRSLPQVTHDSARVQLPRRNSTKPEPQPTASQTADCRDTLTRTVSVQLTQGLAQMPSSFRPAAPDPKVAKPANAGVLPVGGVACAPS